MPKQWKGSFIPFDKELDSLEAHGHQFINWLRVKNYAPTTIKNRDYELSHFFEWARERGMERPQDITKPVLERYMSYLHHYRKKNGAPMGARTQHGRIMAVKVYFSWLAKNNQVLYNPASDLDMPKLEAKLPRAILTTEEVAKVMNAIHVRDPIGIRDRAIMETFYSTGVRRIELVNMCLDDLDYERGTVMIRLGKGRKDRVIPIGDTALLWIRKYLKEVRPELSPGLHEDHVFLTDKGTVFTTNMLTALGRYYIDKSGVSKKGACHIFRHTMATTMLENGADIRYIQAMLGHEKLETTQIYTKVSIKKLKSIHSSTHPTAKITSN